MNRPNISSRLMATAALGAMLLGAVPAFAKEEAAPATTAPAKPQIGDFGFDLGARHRARARRLRHLRRR